MLPKYSSLQVLVACHLLAACAAAEQTVGLAPTDLSWVQAGVPRNTVEARLGSAETTATGLASYGFDRGYIPPSRGTIWWPAVVVGSETMNLLSFGSRSWWVWKCQRAMLLVAYDQDDRVVSAREELVAPSLDLPIGRPTYRLCRHTVENLAPSSLEHALAW